LNDKHQSHARGRNQLAVDGSPPSLRTQGSHTYSQSSDSDSDNESEAEIHSNHTEVDKTLVTTDLETARMQRMHEGTDLTLTPEMVAVALNTSSPDLTKPTVRMSRAAEIKA